MNKIKTLALSTVFGTVFASASEVKAQRDLLVAIDVSGSMGELIDDETHGTTTKLELAKILAKSWVESHVNSTDSVRLSIFKFSDSEFEPVLGDFIPVNAGSLPVIDQLIDQVSAPEGWTPLAMAMCDAYDVIVEATGETIGGVTSPNLDVEKYLYIASDGLENSTPFGGSDNHPCGGPDSEVNEYGNYSAFSWQWLVRNKLLTGDPLQPAHDLIDEGNLGIIAEVDMIFSCFDLANCETPFYYAPSQTYSSYQTGIDRKDYEFFLGIAAETGGRLTKIVPNEEGIVEIDTVVAERETPGVFGDLNGDGCVDGQDAVSLRSQFGNASTLSDEAAKADLNRDGTVNGLDYMKILGLFGQGCKP